MGISLAIAEAIVREHVYRPFTGKVIGIGRQTFRFSPEKALDLLTRVNAVVPDINLDKIAVDTETQNVPQNERFIRDDSFFELLGIKDLHSIDHTNYEGADIIHDLNTPLPDKLCNIADVIIDGSTLDNVFNPTLALVSMSKMLRPGGRLFTNNFASINQATAVYDPYMVFSPFWFFDYFVINGYKDCRVYIQVFDEVVANQYCIYAIDPNLISINNKTRSILASDNIMGILVIAEKGENSTSDRIPTQWAYQTEEQEAEYLSRLKLIQSSDRPDLMFSSTYIPVQSIPSYRLVEATDINQICYPNTEKIIELSMRQLGLDYNYHRKVINDLDLPLDILFMFDKDSEDPMAAFDWAFWESYQHLNIEPVCNINFEFSGEFTGIGWGEAENSDTDHSWRWLGGHSSRSSIFLKTNCIGDIKLKVSIHSAEITHYLHTIECSVNGGYQTQNQEIYENDSFYFFSAVIPKKIIKESQGYLWIAFTAGDPSLKKKGERGIAFSQIALEGEQAISFFSYLNYKKNAVIKLIKSTLRRLKEKLFNSN